MTDTTPTPAGCPPGFATVSTVTPSAARPELVTLPVAMSCGAMRVTVSLGIAKPIPTAAPPICGSLAARVGMPMTCPDKLTSAPPLFPGLIAALVWMVLMSTAELPSPSDTVRPVADTIPSVTVPVSPSGLPMASTISPPRTSLDLPNVAGRIAVGGFCTRITARSSGANTPRTLAASVLLVLDSLTCTFLAVPTTCAFVTMSPCLSNTTPEPSPCDVVICTTEGSTLATTRSYCCCRFAGPPAAGTLGAGLVLAPAPVLALTLGLLLLLAPLVPSPPPLQATKPPAIASSASAGPARRGHPFGGRQAASRRQPVSRLHPIGPHLRLVPRACPLFFPHARSAGCERDDPRHRNRCPRGHHRGAPGGAGGRHPDCARAHRVLSGQDRAPGPAAALGHHRQRRG